jgi:hypothetical protein
MDYPISAGQRSSLLAACEELLRQINQEGSMNSASSPDRSAKEASALYSNLADLRQQYRLHLPVLPLSRCPFTGQVVYHSLDPLGLDGFFWDFHDPIRFPTYLPSPLFSFSGALQLGNPVEKTRFLCLPGPGIPFVIPEFMGADGVKAVIYSLRIGSHTGYPILYFTDPVPPGIEPVNDWGADHWKRVDVFGTVHWNESVDFEDEYDFDLVPYIRSKKLLWISPGDRTMTLRSGTDGCPYVDLKGERRIQRIQDGKVWTT